MGEGKGKKKNGRIFLGNPVNLKRDGYDSEGGEVDYDPEFECTGGSTDPTDRRCPYQLRSSDAMGLGLTGWEGRLLHMNMPSYRDPLCPRTLKNLFTKAKRPFDIRVRVLQQNVPSEDAPCLEEYCKMMADLRRETGGGDTSKGGPAGDECPHRDQVFIHAINAKDAAGPTYARGLLGQDIHEAYEKNQLGPQDFCMSTDSHMDFEPHWDQAMVDMWDAAENEYAVLSTYVANIDQLGLNANGGLNGKFEVPHLCMVIFTSQVRTHATKCARNLSRPKLTNAVWGAGLSFSKCHAELKVPVDPHTPGVFDGEEFNRAARFWTYGYDIYTPHRVYVLHDYPGSQHNPKTMGWGHGKFGPSEVKNAYYRLNTMLDIPGGEKNYDKGLALKRSKYGLGDRRSLDQLIQFSGIDLRHKKVTIDGKNRCGNLQWVPFIENPKGVNFIPKFDGATEEPLDLPYEKTSVWYDPHVDGVGAGMVSRQQTESKEEGPAEAESRRAVEEAAHDAHRKEAEELAGGSLHREHEALAAALEAEDGSGPGGRESREEGGHHDRISNAGAAALEAEEGGVQVFPPLLRGAPGFGGIPKGRFFFSSVKMSKHGVEHLPVPVKLAVLAMVLGICFAVIASGGVKRKRRANTKKSG
eukprot:CAMPEP_0172529920 /NCGR_PEP_ID=MMETSP1067-20121228/3848_1 /TAXON_ID=265564 ORGANISM="Thalassiosira punctigera, Strain Tpunct2005C2" /NCGR_SAMPLE_ID=MMETSP1067 /ASSEMBLY_ACC=CAM_ASM_000444 /LENGTH=638 /DNA_ID=CAMNT_0013314053 /DNA_START=131 /DNA_END=2047 /DNA_ORIENTATION=+